jgi:hypothetical protein
MNEEIKNVRNILAAAPNKTGVSIEERRLQMDLTASLGHLPRDCSVEAVDAGGVPAEWIKHKGGLEDRATFTVAVMRSAH